MKDIEEKIKDFNEEAGLIETLKKGEVLTEVAHARIKHLEEIHEQKRLEIEKEKVTLAELEKVKRAEENSDEKKDPKTTDNR